MSYLGEHPTLAKQNLRHHVCSDESYCITTLNSTIMKFMLKDRSNYWVTDYVRIEESHVIRISLSTESGESCWQGRDKLCIILVAVWCNEIYCVVTADPVFLSWNSDTVVNISERYCWAQTVLSYINKCTFSLFSSLFVCHPFELWEHLFRCVSFIWDIINNSCCSFKKKEPVLECGGGTNNSQTIV